MTEALNGRCLEWQNVVLNDRVYMVLDYRVYVVLNDQMYVVLDNRGFE